MNQENDKNKKGFSVNTPLEYIGFGFSVMAVVSIIVSFGTQSGYQGFQECMLVMYLFISGPFIIYGISKGMAQYSDAFNRVTVGTSAMAHYAGFISMNWMDNWDCFFVFLAVYVIAPIICLILNRFKHND